MSGSLLLLLFGCYAPPALPPFEGVPLVSGQLCAAERVERVGCVVDGDTFDLGACGAEAERVRMLGIDAPEIAHETEAECWADEAWAALEREIGGRDVLLSFDHECFGVFGRTLAYVWLETDPEPVLLNEWMLAQGHVRLYEEDFGEELRLRERLEAAEGAARSRGLGLWGACP